MTKLSANRAAKEAGIAKKTLLEAISSGRLSADKNDKGHWQIDPAELFRVFPKTSDETPPKTVSRPPEKTIENNPLQGELKSLRQQIDNLTIERDRERAQMSETIEDLRTRLDAESTERRALTQQLTDQRQKPAEHSKRGLWARLVG